MSGISLLVMFHLFSVFWGQFLVLENQRVLQKVKGVNHSVITKLRIIWVIPMCMSTILFVVMKD